MTSKAREYIDFWIEASVHAAEQFRTPGASQDVAVLVRRLIDSAKAEGVTEEAMLEEVGNLSDYIRNELAAVNKAEGERHK
jgi:hypothetical protein